MWAQRTSPQLTASGTAADLARRCRHCTLLREAGTSAQAGPRTRGHGAAALCWPLAVHQLSLLLLLAAARQVWEVGQPPAEGAGLHPGAAPGRMRCRRQVTLGHAAGAQQHPASLAHALGMVPAAAAAAAQSKLPPTPHLQGAGGALLLQHPVHLPLSHALVAVSVRACGRRVRPGARRTRHEAKRCEARSLTDAHARQR